MKIPVERGGSKLDLRSIKRIFISYFRHDAYWIFDPMTWKIFRSCDVVFKEGIGHKTLPPLVDLLSGDSEASSTIPPATDTHPVHNTPQPEVRLAPPHPDPILRCLTWNARQSKAVIDSIASEQAVEEACTAGEDWATDPARVSLVSLAELAVPPDIPDSDDDSDLVPVLHATTVDHTPPPEPDNHWLPDSYTEAMTCPDLWQGPIKKELAIMRDCKV